MILDNSQLIPFIQIFVALLLGMILGIERVLAGRTAGPRTYGLVSIGACLVAIVAQTVIAQHPEWTGADPFHLVSSVVTGVGFIGAGLIVFKGSKLSGLTTAAGIWVAAVIGLTVGFEMYLLAFFATFLTLFVFTVMWQFEHKLINFLALGPHRENSNQSDSEDLD